MSVVTPIEQRGGHGGQQRSTTLAGARRSRRSVPRRRGLVDAARPATDDPGGAGRRRREDREPDRPPARLVGQVEVRLDERRVGDEADEAAGIRRREQAIWLAPPGRAANQRWVVGLALDRTRNGSPDHRGEDEQRARRGRCAVRRPGERRARPSGADEQDGERDHDQRDLQPRRAAARPSHAQASRAPPHSPPSSVDWKNTSAVVQTALVPPYVGQQRTRDQRFDEECERRREERDEDEEGSLRYGDRAGYSPITDQIRPIMMKKPLNRAIRPRPPYGVLAPTCGTSWRHDPEAERPRR